MGKPSFAGFDEQNRTVLLRGPFGAPYVINPNCAAAFKFAHGDIVASRKGPEANRAAIVLGELHDNLWIHFLDDNGAVPLKFCSSYNQLLEKYDLQNAQPPHGSIAVPTILGGSYYFQTAGLFNKFGVHPGERAFIGSKNKGCTIVGENLGILWVKFDDNPTIAAPLVGATSEDSLRSIYSICEEPGRGMTPVPSPRKTPRNTTGPPFSVDEARHVAVCSQPFGKVEVDIRNTACREAFAVIHGQRLVAKRGALDGQTSTVIGVKGGNLYIHTEGDKYVTCCRNCNDGVDLHEVYGFEISGAKKSSKTAAPTAPAAATNITPRKPQISTTPQSSSSSKDEVASPTTVNPPRHFQCWTAFGRLDFDSSESGCKPYGFFHQQSLKASVGPDKGKIFHVVGERMGTLWVLQDGKSRATALSHCKSHEDIKKRHGFVVIGKQSLKHLPQVVNEPPPTPISSPRGGGSSPRGIMHTPRGVSSSIERNSAAAPPQMAASPVPMLNLSNARPTEPVQQSYPSASPYGAASPSPSASPQRNVQRDVEEPWVEGRMPATRHYLKAVALLKTGAASSSVAPTAFHQYYLSNSSQRISTALQQMHRFRNTWIEEQNRSGVPCAFSHATTDEMFALMRARRDLFV